MFKPALSRKFHISWNATLLHCGILPPICNRETDVITTAALLKRMHLVTVEVSCMGSFRWGTDKRQQHQPDWDNVHSVVMKTMEMCWWWWIWWWQGQPNKYKQYLDDTHSLLLICTQFNHCARRCRWQKRQSSQNVLEGKAYSGSRKAQNLHLKKADVVKCWTFVSS